MASAEYQREWRLRNLEKVREGNRKWRQKRRAELGTEWLARSAAGRKRWRAANSERNRELGRAWYQRNKHKPHVVSSRRDTKYLNRYGIRYSEKERMFAAQSGKCAICEKLFACLRTAYVDHDHKTRAVRGLVCQFCNSMLGNAKDNPSILRAAIAYLQRTSCLS